MYGARIMKPVALRLTATGTYTSPVNCKYIQVYIIGGGGSGAGGTGTLAGGGGGPGQVLLLYLDAGVYTYVIRAAAAGVAAGVNGNPGLDTTFNGVDALGGTEGEFTSPTIAASSSVTGAAGTIRMGMIAAQAGMIGDTSGNGGSNMFGLNGQGAQSTDYSYNGATGSLFGSGGAGGLGATGTGAAGQKGGCIVIEHY